MDADRSLSLHGTLPGNTAPKKRLVFKQETEAGFLKDVADLQCWRWSGQLWFGSAKLIKKAILLWGTKQMKCWDVKTRMWIHFMYSMSPVFIQGQKSCAISVKRTCLVQNWYRQTACLLSLDWVFCPTFGSYIVKWHPSIIFTLKHTTLRS